MVQSDSIPSIIVISLLLGIPIFLGWLVLLVNCANANFKSDGAHISWILIIIFLGPIGALLYLVAGKAQKVQEEGKDKWVL